MIGSKLGIVLLNWYKNGDSYVVLRYKIGYIMENHEVDPMSKHSRTHSSRKTNKNVKSYHNFENVTKSVVPEIDIATIKMFSNLDISDKTSQSSSCDPSSADQLIKNKKYLKFGPLGSTPDFPSHSLPDSHSPGIKQDKNMDQSG